jgi:glycine/D-amino acid oxidase-like deaminating enzyme
MNVKEVDFLIVGHGIAGAVLSQYLLSQNQRVHVIERPKENSASRVAAGIYNPVAYRSLKMAEFANVFIPKAQKFYSELEKKLEKKFFDPLPFFKLLTSVEELNNWNIRSAIAQNSPFMHKEISTENFQNTVANPFGAGQVLEAGVLRTHPFLQACEDMLQRTNSITFEGFDHSKMELDEGIKYQNIYAKKVVFCEGVGMVNNPWFNWLPLQLFKGEVLEIHAPTLPVDVVINKGVFILPVGEGIFKVGATHDWRNMDEITTEEGKRQLLEKLDSFIQVPYTITAHRAGLRPASRDRKAFIGHHPNHENLMVFNGLGSKGVITAPWLAEHFFEHLASRQWDKTFNITRYHKFFSHDS